MSLRRKVLAIVIGAILLYSGLEYVIHRTILFPGFLQLEEFQAEQDLQRVRLALDSEIEHLDKFCRDWAAWDDTYAFVASAHDGYVASNLGLTTFLDNRINLIYFYDARGHRVWGEAHELFEGRPLHLSLFAGEQQPQVLTLPQELPSLRPAADLKAAGILATEHGPLLLAVRPVLTSNNQGPVRGTLIMGRLFDQVLLGKLIERTRLKFSFLALDDLPGRESYLDGADIAAYHFDKSDDRDLTTAQVFADLAGEPAFLVNVHSPRLFLQTVSLTLRHMVLSLALAGLVFLVLVSALLQGIVLGPLHRLTEHVRAIRADGTLSARLKLKRSDEIGLLAREFDLMMSEIEQKSSDLAEANGELQRISLEDRLTGVANRRRFDDCLSKEWKRLQRERRPLSLILCDVDYFKQYNDTYGHLQGDQCLRAVAHVLGEKIHRPGDLAARYGGEEFAAVLVDTDLEGALIVAQTFLGAVQELRIPHRASPLGGRITVSIGVATLKPEASMEPEALVSLADQALYLAKQNGRNQVQFLDLSCSSGYQPSLWSAC